jgi:hypothetical protein
MLAALETRIENSTKYQYSDRGARPLKVAYLRNTEAIAWPKVMSPSHRARAVYRTNQAP